MNSPILTPTSYNIKTVNNVRRTIVYYDPEVFEDTILLSASMLIGSDTIPFQYHYNTVHDEDTGLSGTDWKPLEAIAIAIYPVPKRTKIEGLKKMDIGSTLNYKIENGYDPTNIYTYDWYLLGNANFSNNSTEYLNAGKNVDITFPSVDNIIIKCKITNPAGCFRWITKQVFAGQLTKSMLVVRYPYF